MEPYLSVYSSTALPNTHPGVDISILEYLGKQGINYDAHRFDTGTY
jgi:hypothetical protein